MLNRHLCRYTFGMLTHKTLCRSICPADWFVTIDLENASFHIAIYPPHRTFLWFAHQGTAYEFQIIPLRLLLAPQVFSKCVEAALTPLQHRHSLVHRRSFDMFPNAGAGDQRLKRLTDLGFRMNWTKAVWYPNNVHNIWVSK